MNETVNTFLLVGNKFMLEMHLRQSGFTFSAACGPYMNNRKNTKFKETGDLRYIYQNKLDKACFQHYIASGDFKDLNRIIFADKVLYDKAFNIAKDSIYDGYQRGVASMAYKLFDKKTPGRGIKNENIHDKKLVKELH